MRVCSLYLSLQANKRGFVIATDFAIQDFAQFRAIKLGVLLLKDWIRWRVARLREVC